MRLKLSEWAERTYSEDSRPCGDTLRIMAREGDIKGAVCVRKRWYVDAEERKVSADELLRRAVGDDPVMLKVVGL